MQGSKAQTSPRLYVLRASAAARAVVFAAHRQKRWSLYLWDPERRSVEPGGVFFGTLYPRRCDLSPDGRYLLYFALKKGPDDPDWPREFSGLSRAPWLACLLAWEELGTWTRGMHFASPSSGQPEIPGPLHRVVDSIARCPWNVERTAAIQLAAERRIGFVETEDSPARDSSDVWDQRRRAVLRKRRPDGGPEELRVWLSDFRVGEGLIEGYRNLYGLRQEDGRVVPLPAYVWLDWLDRAHVYGATCDGRLVVCALRGEELVEVWSHVLEESPRRSAPAWARSW